MQSGSHHPESIMPAAFADPYQSSPTEAQPPPVTAQPKSPPRLRNPLVYFRHRFQRTQSKIELYNHWYVFPHPEAYILLTILKSPKRRRVHRATKSRICRASISPPNSRRTPPNIRKSFGRHARYLPLDHAFATSVASRVMPI
jgi:hypothetical protein